MDKSLSVAVEKFVTETGEVLADAAVGTSVNPKQLRKDTILEAYNLCAAIIDSKGQHTDIELWSLITAFSYHGLLPGIVSPDAMRRNSILRNKRKWLIKQSELFRTLRQVDEIRNTGAHLSRTYYEEAMALAHVTLAVDPNDAKEKPEELTAFQDMILDALSSDAPQAATDASATDDKPNPIKDEELSDEREPIEDLMDELGQLVGLSAVKEEIRLLTALIKVQKLRAERDLPTLDSSKHLIFSGNPGTGKTTVARLIARIYRSLEVVEKGHVVEVDRSGLVAGFIGQTAKKVADVFDRADGGVLIIDEAYSLTRGGEKDFGREAIDSIVKHVEDKRESMVVILAGYPNEMKELVDSNPGFQSRFPRTINFADYDNGELVEILKILAAKATYELSPEAEKAAEIWFAAQERDRGFGNGRLARNLFEAAVARHAERVSELTDPSDEQLTTLEEADIALVPNPGFS